MLATSSSLRAPFMRCKSCATYGRSRRRSRAVRGRALQTVPRQAIAPGSTSSPQARGACTFGQFVGRFGTCRCNPVVRLAPRGLAQHPAPRVSHRRRNRFEPHLPCGGRGRRLTAAAVRKHRAGKSASARPRPSSRAALKGSAPIRRSAIDPPPGSASRFAHKSPSATARQLQESESARLRAAQCTAGRPNPGGRVPPGPQTTRKAGDIR